MYKKYWKLQKTLLKFVVIRILLNLSVQVITFGLILLVTSFRVSDIRSVCYDADKGGVIILLALRRNEVSKSQMSCGGWAVINDNEDLLHLYGC